MVKLLDHDRSTTENCSTHKNNSLTCPLPFELIVLLTQDQDLMIESLAIQTKE